MTALSDLLTTIGAKHWFKMAETAATATITSSGSVGGLGPVGNQGTPSYEQVAPGDDLKAITYNGTSSAHSAAVTLTSINGYNTGVVALCLKPSSAHGATFQEVLEELIQDQALWQRNISEIEKKKKEVTKVKEEKQGLLRSIQSQKVVTQKVIVELEERAKELQSLIGKLEREKSQLVYVRPKPDIQGKTDSTCSGKGDQFI